MIADLFEMKNSDSADIHPRMHLLRHIILPWIAFWSLMLIVGVQEYVRSGGRDLWAPLIDYGTAMAVATTLVTMQIFRGRRLGDLLGHPLRWFARMWVWMPLQFVVYVIAMYALRKLLYSMADMPLLHEPWPEVVAYEASKFIIFYALFSAIHFGLLSYGAWANERLRTEQQAHLARQAQLTQLTQQLQPHFLFNTLNTISALVHDDPDTADHLIGRLAMLLRAAVDAGRCHQQSFSDELALVKAYADIMLQRFADRARMTWDVEQGTLACRVPTLGFQPLVENCFRHVVERRAAPTHIVMRATRVEGRLHVSIEDDGETHKLPTSLGVGLGNLQSRLRSMYGQDAALTLQLREGGGLIVRVALPCAC
ncbi:sensor histidine kinase [Burkholderia metallica]